MQAFYPPRFEREMGCTEAEWIGWLPRACGGAAIADEPGGVSVAIAGGTLRLRWQVLTPRRIAMIVLPRLAVSFEFVAVAEAERQRFMRHFDLATQRGGG